MSVPAHNNFPILKHSPSLFQRLAVLPAWLHYLLSLVIVAIATLLLIRLQHFVAVVDGLKHGPSFVAFFFIAIALATLIGGLRVGFITVLLSLFSTAYFLIPPKGITVQPTMSNYMTLLIVISVGSLVALGMEAYRNNAQLLDQNTKLLAEEQIRANQETVLNRIGQAVRSARTPEQVQRVAAESVGEVLCADRCFFMAYNPVKDLATIGQFWRADGADEYMHSFSLRKLGIDVDSLYLLGSTIVVDDIKTSDSGDHYGMRSVVIVPIATDNQTEPTLVVSMNKEMRHWTKSEVGLIEAVASQTKAAVESARIRQREHNIAIQLQAALQPALSLDVPGVSVASFYRAALEEANVGGDFYDAFELDNGVVCYVVGDVSGKGLAAASQVAAIRHMLRCLLQTMPNIVSAIEQLNDVLVEQNLLPAFATLFVALFNPSTLALEYVSCGHEPGLIHRPGLLDEIIELPATGPVIGVFEHSHKPTTENYFAVGHYQLRPGDSLLLYTDGVCDAGKDITHLLGVAGIVEMLSTYYSQSEARDENMVDSSSNLLNFCVAATESFANGVLRDDICLLSVVIAPNYQVSAHRMPVIDSVVNQLAEAENPETVELRKVLLADVLKLATRGKLRVVKDISDLPATLLYKSDVIPLDVGENVRLIRRSVREAGHLSGLSIAFSDSLEMASGEAANNSLVHAVGGQGLVSWDDDGCVQVRIEDSGHGIPYEDLPRATLERGFTTAGTLGQGFWIILQSVKRCWIATSEKGTVVVLEQDNQDASEEALPVSILI